MNSIDLWNEAEHLTEQKEKRLIEIGNELFNLYDVQYGNSEDKELIEIVFERGNTWNIYDDIWKGMTFKESINKHREEYIIEDK